MENYHDLVPLPARTGINTGLSAARQSTMLELLGKPGALSYDCSPITNATISARTVRRSVGPIVVVGLDVAVASLERIFVKVRTERPNLYDVVRTAGMQCCRAVRGSHTNYSNHSWGTAIDITIQSQIDQMGARKCQRGILDLYHYFHEEGWYWGAGYTTRPDPMHFELANETVRKLFAK